jgi:hypothetical protein
LIERLEGVELLLDCSSPSKFLNLGRVNANRKDADLHAGTVSVNSQSIGGKAEDTSAAAQEVARVAVGLETNEVGTEDTLEDFLAPGKTAEEFATGKRRVEKEGDVHVGDSLAQHAREEHEEIVVNHNNIAGLVVLNDLVGKLLVHPVVIRPLHSLATAIGRLMLLVVKQRVEIVLGVATPAGLVLEEDTFFTGLGLVGEPDGECADRLAVGQLVLEFLLVLERNPETIIGRGRRQPSVCVNGNWRRERVEGRDTEGVGCRGCCDFFYRGLDLAGPSDNGVAPWRSFGREVGKRVEKGGLTTTRFEFLKGIDMSKFGCGQAKQTRNISQSVKWDACAEIKNEGVGLSR